MESPREALLMPKSPKGTRLAAGSTLGFGRQENLRQQERVFLAPNPPHSIRNLRRERHQKAKGVSVPSARIEFYP